MLAVMRTIDSPLRDSTRIDRSLPANLTADDAVLFEDQFTYSTYDSYLRCIGKAKVSADSVVYKNYAPVVESLYRAESVAYYRFRYLAKKVLTARKIQLEASKAFLLATDQDSSGHFHWFTEVLPRLWLVKGRTSEFDLMLPDTPYMRAVGVASLDHVDLRFAGIYWMKPDEFYSVPNLYHLSKVSRTGQMQDGIMKELNQALIGKRPTGNRKFYISRKRADFRKVLNEPELTERLASYDFEVLYPEDLSLADQIEAFSQCGTLIGIHGAGLTNSLFMPPGGKVVELRKREPNFGYWHLAGSVGHKYYYYHGVPDSDLSLIGRGCNLTIPIDDFEEEILKVI